jgi:hypothetical protein
MLADKRFYVVVLLKDNTCFILTSKTAVGRLLNISYSTVKRKLNNDYYYENKRKQYQIYVVDGVSGLRQTKRKNKFVGVSSAINRLGFDAPNV